MNVTRLCTIALLCAVHLNLVAEAHAVPPGIPYGGQLSDPTGAPYTGTLDVEASLFAQPTGGQAVWGPHVFAGVQADNGAFAVVLDDAGEPLAEALDGLAEAWLEFAVKPVGEPAWILLEGRQQLLSVAYAHIADNAANSAQLGGVDALDYVTQAALAQAGYATAANVFSGSFLDLIDVPTALLDGDQDTLSLLTCAAAGYVPKWTGTGWGCATDDVGAATSLDGLLKADGSVALTGAWDLGGQLLSGVVIAPADAPVVEAEGALWFDTTAGKLKVYNGTAWDALGLADVVVAADLACGGCVDASDLNFTLATVATTGQFADLVGIPDGLSDGDDDQLQELGPTCTAAGDVAKWNGTGWECAPDAGVRADELQSAIATGLSDQLAAAGPEAITGGLLTNKFSGSFAATDTPVAFSGYSPIYAESVITIPDIGKALSFTVTVNIAHPDATALDVHLVPPAEIGPEIVLHQLGAGTAGGLVGTYPTELTIFQGSFDGFVGKNLAGAWTLKVRDNVGPPIDDDGSIAGWSVGLDYEANSKLAISGSLFLSGDLALAGALNGHPIATESDTAPIPNAIVTTGADGHIPLGLLPNIERSLTVLSGAASTVAEATTDRSTRSDAFVKFKEFEAFAAGDYTVSFTYGMGKAPAGGSATVQIQVGGNPVFTSPGEAGIWTTLQPTIHVNSGDLIQILLRTSSTAADPAHVRDVKLQYGGLKLGQTTQD